jgi:hypothetical protein
MTYHRVSRDSCRHSAAIRPGPVGLSNMYRGGLAQLDAAMILYDAFYRWARDAVNETHDWPAAALPPRISNREISQRSKSTAHFRPAHYNRPRTDG